MMDSNRQLLSTLQQLKSYSITEPVERKKLLLNIRFSETLKAVNKK